MSTSGYSLLGSVLGLFRFTFGLFKPTNILGMAQFAIKETLLLGKSRLICEFSLVLETLPTFEKRFLTVTCFLMGNKGATVCSEQLSLFPKIPFVVKQYH